MTKIDKKHIRAEIRRLKSALTRRQKETARDIKKHRTLIHKTETQIAETQRQADLFTKKTEKSIAIHENRLHS